MSKKVMECTPQPRFNSAISEANEAVANASRNFGGATLVFIWITLGFTQVCNNGNLCENLFHLSNLHT